MGTKRTRHKGERPKTGSLGGPGQTGTRITSDGSPNNWGNNHRVREAQLTGRRSNGGGRGGENARSTKGPDPSLSWSVTKTEEAYTDLFILDNFGKCRDKTGKRNIPKSKTMADAPEKRMEIQRDLSQAANLDCSEESVIEGRGAGLFFTRGKKEVKKQIHNSRGIRDGKVRGKKRHSCSRSLSA